MDKLSIKMRLISEMIFGSGGGIPGSIDLEVVHDEYGLPYLKGKTFKGKLREEAENIVANVKSFDLEIGEMLDTECDAMFGVKCVENPMAIKFSDCNMGDEIVNSIKYGIKNRMFTSDEVLNAITSVRSYTSIDGETGAAAPGALRRFRVINKGFCFVCELYTEEDLEDIRMELLAAAVSSLRHIGTMRSRGKGEVRCGLYKNDVDVTEKYVESFRKRVIA